MVSRFSFVKLGLVLALALLSLLALWAWNRVDKTPELARQHVEGAVEYETRGPGELRGLSKDSENRAVLSATKPSQSAEPLSNQPPGSGANGSIVGRVTLLDGTPVPGVRVDATPVTLATAEYGFDADTETDATGRFELQGLELGTYKLSVSSSWDLSINGSNTHKTGSDSVELAIDASTVWLQAVHLDGKPAKVKRILCSEVNPNGAMETGLIYAIARIQQTLGAQAPPLSAGDVEEYRIPIGDAAENTTHERPTDTAQFILPTTKTFRFESNHMSLDDPSIQQRGRTFYGLLAAGKPSGVHLLKLLENPPSLGTIQLIINQPALPDRASLNVWKVKVNGDSILPPTRDSLPAKSGTVEMTFPALMPGDYEIRIELNNSGLVRLTQNTVRLTVHAGMLETRNLETTEHGTLHICARTAHPTDAGTFATVSLQRPGSSEWKAAMLHTREAYPGGSKSVRKPAVLVGGPAGVSEPLPAGKYGLRIRLPGHTPVEKSVLLGQGETKTVSVELQAE
jgi:hypothetical protein